jgi:hypothetical protein
VRSPPSTMQASCPAGGKTVDFRFLSALTNPTGVAVILMNKFQTDLESDEGHVANGAPTLLWPLRSSFHSVCSSTVRESILMSKARSGVPNRV